MRRRDFLAGGLATAVGTATPAAGALAQAAPARQNRVIDAHCHLFNVLDVPTENFINKVVLPNVVNAMRTSSRDYAALFDRYKETFAVMLHMLTVAVSKRAREPGDEISMLERMEHKAAVPPSVGSVELSLLIDILNEVWWPTKVQQGMRVGQTFVTFYALEQIKYLLRKEAFPGKTEQELRGQSSLEAKDHEYAAKELYGSRDGVFSRAIRWGLLFTRYRFQLAEELQRLHGGRARLLTPALVDFGAWFGPPPAGSGERNVPMRQQVEVMSHMSRRRNGPRVHGFVGFDPLRQAFFRSSGLPAVDEPMAIVRSAIEERGFIGVKLYPPMGFRPVGNAELGNDFPAFVLSGLGNQPGARLDAALDELYGWCAQNNVPIMAHTANTYGSAANYGLRASPAGWVKVLEKHPTLRLNLAHFGGFNRDGDRQHPERAWGWIIGKMFGKAETPNVYADISFFSEIMHRTGELRSYVVWMFKKFLAQFPAAKQRLLYGTDWTMVGYADGFPARAVPESANAPLYPDVVADFLRRDLGFTPNEIDDVMFENAVRFMGLGEDQRAEGTRGRLERFYQRANLSAAWMQDFDKA